MTKRIAAICLVLGLIFSLMPATAHAQTEYVVGNGVTIPNANVPVDGSNPYCNCDLAVGSGHHTCCWNFGYYAYYHIWGQYPYRYDDSMLYLRNVSAKDRILTEENLYKYLKNAAPGAIMRIDKRSDPNAGDDEGHTLIYVRMNEQGDGAWFLEGNYDGKGRSRLSEISFSKLVSSFGPDSRKGYRYIKYIGWPNAPEYYETYEDLCQSYTSHCVIEASQDTLAMRYPCESSVDPSSTVVQTVFAGDTYDALALLRNDRNDYWYRIETESGELAYIPADAVAHVGQTDWNVTLRDVRAPEYLYEGKSFSIKGTIESDDPITQVAAYVYAGHGTEGKVLTGGSAQTSGNRYSLSGSQVDNQVRFGSLDKGNYTFALWVTLESSHLSEDGTLTTREETVCLYQTYFTVMGWDDEAVQITFDAGEGQSMVQTGTITAGTAIGNLPIAYREGYVLAGWQTQDGETVTEETVFTQDEILYAQWLLPQCHEAGAAVRENETEFGYDEVTYCIHCGKELHRTHTTLASALPLGDANGDGKVNNIDAMMALQYSVGTNSQLEIFLEACDINGDGKVNNIDAMLILQLSVGIC